MILFSTKSYHKRAIQDLKPFVGESTVIIPLLNGIAHVSLLQKEFGEEKVIGGLCFIETTLNNQGNCVQTSAANRLMFGEMKSQDSENKKHISKAFAGTNLVLF